MNDKDQAAIDHVASVSKNPHAAMIVKQLITGWNVEFEYAAGEWRISANPSWSPGSKYRLIEPKPAKPAYRVYKRKGQRETYTQDRFNDGKLSYLNNPEVVEFLSDWIEYDPPKKWPTPLVERIAAIDLDAAQWIVDNWDELLNDRYLECFGVSMESDRLKTMFAWSSSPQGKEYWYAISKQLGES